MNRFEDVEILISDYLIVIGSGGHWILELVLALLPPHNF
jgi:hypothetical protein